MKILNLYAGLGGNRELWTNHEITAIEINKYIALKYKKKFKEDKVIITDAHQYLLKHYNEYDLVWSSRPCTTHSRARYWNTKAIRLYPDIKLYEEIIFLKHHCKTKWVVENVIPYYEPLIKPNVKLGRHLIWSNFYINPIEIPNNETNILHINTKDKTELRNKVNPEIGLYILNQAENKKNIWRVPIQLDIFEL